MSMGGVHLFKIEGWLVLGKCVLPSSLMVIAHLHILHFDIDEQILVDIYFSITSILFLSMNIYFVENKYNFVE